MRNRATFSRKVTLFTFVNYYFGNALHDKDMPFLPKGRLELFADFAEEFTEFTEMSFVHSFSL